MYRNSTKPLLRQAPTHNPRGGGREAWVGACVGPGGQFLQKISSPLQGAAVSVITRF